MNEDELLALIHEVSSETRGMHKAIASMCPNLQTLAGMPRDDLKRKLASISFEHKASTPYDDDEYWLAQCPFNNLWYVFASLPCAGWPTTPVYVLNERPAWFDED